MNSKGQTGIWEGIIILILILFLVGTIFFAGWLLYRKPNQTDIYQNGSRPEVIQPDIHPSFGGCVDVRVEEWKHELTNKVGH